MQRSRWSFWAEWSRRAEFSQTPYTVRAGRIPSRAGKEDLLCVPALPCSRGGGYFGRNLDLEYSFGEQVAVTPRRYPLRFHRQPAMERHLALIGMAHVTGGCPLYAEAMNEKGLYMAGLNFPGNAWYDPDPPADCDAVAPYELIPWVLGSLGRHLEQARARLARFRPLGVPFAPGLPLSPLHWHIADPTGALVLEATREGVFLYDDPGRGADQQPALSPSIGPTSANTRGSAPGLRKTGWLPGCPFPHFGPGDGRGGPAPATFPPPPAMSKAAFLKLNSPDPGSEEERVVQFFHLLEGVAMVRGSVVTPEGREDITTYSCCISAGAGVYYYKTYGKQPHHRGAAGRRRPGRRRPDSLSPAKRP